MSDEMQHPDIIRSEHYQMPGGGWERVNYWNCGCVDDFVISLRTGVASIISESVMTTGTRARRRSEFPACARRRWPALARDAGSAGEQV